MTVTRTKTLWKWLVVGMIVVLVVSVIVWYAAPRPPRKIIIATGTKGGTYYPLGQQFELILDGLPGTPIDATAKESNGSQENIERLLKLKAHIAFVMGPALLHATPKEQKELRILARLYTDVLQVVVRNDCKIDSLKDLKKLKDQGERKRIYVGANNSGVRIVATHILKTIGISKEEDYIRSDLKSYGMLYLANPMTE